jgi:alkanesulfonate monooxygenase SsuD/methylene tetrahydromethanopterin reductase-like flavin-dependent oxidoreductase (luciferase family)
MAAPFFGYHMPDYSFPGTADDSLFDHVADMTVAAEAAGFDMLTVMDHFYQIRGVGSETEPMLESYTTLAALSQRTKTIRLSALVVLPT